MAYINTYTFKYSSSANIKYTLEFWDQGANASTWANQKGTLGSKDCEINFGSENAKMYAPLKPSTLTIDFMVTDVLSANYLKQLRDNRQERDVYVYLYNTGTTSVKIPGDSPIFAGYLLMDLAEDPDISVPYPMKLRAIDGLASLKYYDFIPHDKSQAADHLYSYNDTWLPGSTNTFNKFYPFRQWISRILRYTGYATTAAGSETEAEFQTSVNWYNGNMPNITGDPLNWTRATADQFYEKEGDTGNIKYRPLNCYDALQYICKTWGMRCFAYKNTFYFIGINTYTADNTGTLAAPVNINYHRYTITGSSATPATGTGLDLNWGRYFAPIFIGEPNQKLAGSQYGVLPSFKRVSVDFLNISNINYFQGFPKIPIPYPISTGSGSLKVEETIGTFDFDGTNDQTFFQEIYLDFQNNSGGDVRYEIRWHIQAKKVGTSTWYQYGYPNWSFSNPYPSWFTMAGIPQNTSVFSRGHLIIPPGPSSYNVVTDLLNPSWLGTSFNMWVECPASVFSAGDWEFKYVTVTEWFSGSQNIAYGHGRCDPIPNPGTSYLTDPDSNFITYTDSSITQGVGSSFFSPIANGIIGTESTNTQIVQSGLDTDFEEVTNVLWGDLPGGGAGRLEVYNGTGWQPSGFQGYWGIDSLTGNNSLAETLCEEIFKRQAQNVRKFSTKINLDAEGYFQSDSSGSRAIIGTPFTRWFTPSHSGSATYSANWIMHTGSFNTGSDTWAFTLYEFETFDKGITTTTTGSNGSNSGGVGTNTGTTGSVVPSQTGGGVGKTLANPARNNSRAIAKIRQNATRPITIVTANQGLTAEGTLTVTSLTVQAIPNAVLKAGDTILVMCQYQPEATASLDETNTIEYGNVEFVLSSDQSAGATTLSVVSKTIYQTITKGDVVTISQPDLMAQYQNKTKGTIGGLTVGETQLGSATEGIYISNGFGSELIENNLFTTNEPANQSRLEGGVQFADWAENPGSGKRTFSIITNGCKSLVPAGTDTLQTSTWHQRIYQQVSNDLIIGKQYKFRAEFRTLGSSGSFRFAIQQLGSTNTQSTHNNTNTSDGIWVTINETFTCTNNTLQYVHIFPNYIQAVGDSFEVKNVSLKQLSTGVGIGNSTPSTPLDVTGTVNATTFTGDLNGTINTATTGTTQSANNNSTKIATTAYVDAATASVPKGLQYQGTWNAATNTPTIVSGTGVVGYYYIVATPGTTTIDGISEWALGDWIIFTDHTTDHWQKIDQSESDTLQTVTTRGATTTDTITVGGLTLNGNIDTNNQSTDILIKDNAGAALEVKQGTDLYLRFNTTNGSENIQINKSTEIAGNITVSGTVDGRDVAADGTQLDTNTSSISTNTSNIATNTSNISTNASAIATKAAASTVATNTSNISSNTTDIATNETDIATNTTAISGKASSASVATNTSAIATNTSNVAANTTDIATNTSAIATKGSATDVSTNATNIATNVTNIATNVTNIATNTSAIATKASASSVTTNTTNIATNATDISTNTTAITGKVSLTGNETIAGTKSFSSIINANEGIYIVGGSIGSGKIILHTNNLMYIRGGSAGLMLQNGDGSAAHQLTSSGNQIFEASGEKMRLVTGGQLLIGHTASYYAGTKLQVGNTTDSQNGLQITTSTSGYGYVLFGDGTGADAYVGQIAYKHSDNTMRFSANATESFIIKNTGIDIAGNIVITGTVDGRDVAADGTQLDTNTSAISTNTGNISTNTTNIATNTSAIATKASATSVTTNTANIATNTSNISSNDTDIATNVTNITTNASNIQTNATNISSNDTDIGTNASNISTNTSNISTNTGNITSNSNAIATKASSSSVATNTSNISTNTSNISTNTNSILGKVSKSGDTMTGLLTGTTATFTSTLNAQGFLKLGSTSSDGYITTNTDRHIFIKPAGSGNLYLGDSGEGFNIYHYNSGEDGTYAIYDFNANYYRIRTTQVNGVWINDTLKITGAVTVDSTVDGVDIAARDAVLTSTTSTATTNASNIQTNVTNIAANSHDIGTNNTIANAALPKAGGTITGNVTFNDTKKAIFGTSDDGLEIYHDSNHSYIEDSGTGELKILSSALAVQSANGNEYIAYFSGTGGQTASLYAGNSKKFETTSTGVLVTGELEATSLDINGNADISGTLDVAGNVDIGGLGGTNVRLTARGSTDDSSAFALEAANSSGASMFYVRNDGLAFFADKINLSSNKAVEWPGGSIRAEGNTLKLVATTLIDLQDNTQIQGALTTTGNITVTDGSLSITQSIGVETFKVTTIYDRVGKFVSTDAGAFLAIQDNTSTDNGVGINVTGDTLKLLTANTAALTVDASQQIGIGTGSPAANLDVFRGSTNGLVAHFTGNNANRGLNISTYQNSNHDAGVILDAVDPSYGTLKFQTSSSDALTLDVSQNATFAGDVNVSDDLNIAGDQLTFTNDSASAYIRGADALFIESDWDNDDPASKPIYFRTNGTEMARMEAALATFAGNIKASASNPFVTIEGNSSSYVNGGVQFISNHASTARGMGNFYYCANSDVEWFSGLPYNDNDSFVINRNASYSVPSSESSPPGIGASAGTLFSIDSSGNATFTGDVIATDGSDTATLKFSGLYLTRSNSYIRSTTDNQDTLNIGQSSERWGHVKVDSSTFKVLNGGNERLGIDSSGNATFAGIVSVPTGKSFRLYNTAGTGWGELSLEESENKIQFNRGIKPTGNLQSDQTLGTSTKRWHTLYSGAGNFTDIVTIGDGHTVGDDADDNLEIKSSANENIIIDGAGRVILRDGGSTKLETSSSGISITGTATVSSRIDTGYGVHFTGGNTNFLLYNNPGEDVLYMRDSTNGSMITYWGVNSFRVYKNLDASDGIDVTGNITVTGTVDGVDIAARDAILSSTTSTANTNASNISLKANIASPEFTTSIQLTDTDSPDLKLYRSGTGQLWNMQVDSSGRLLIKEAASLGGTQYTRLQIDDSGEITSYGLNTISMSGTDKLKLLDDDGSNAVFGMGGNLFSIDLSASSSSRIRVNNSEVFRVDSAGNLTLSGTVDGVDIAARNAVLTTTTTTANTNTTNIASNTTALAAKAPLASPTFTGSPAAPTAPAGTNNTKIATTAFVTAAVSAGGGGAVNRGSFAPSAVQSIGSGGVTGTKSTLTFNTSKITAVGMSVASTGLVNIDDSGDYMINLNFGTESYLTQNRILGAAQIQYSADAEEWVDIDGSKIYTYNRGIATGEGASTWGTIYEGSGHSSIIHTVADDSYIRVQFWVDGRSSSSTGMRTILDSCRLSIHKLA